MTLRTVLNQTGNHMMSAAKAFRTRTANSVGDVLKKLTSCITWTKKSSKGFRALQAAYKDCKKPFRVFATPVKTRFCSVYKCVAQLTGVKDVIQQLYGSQKKAKMRARVPSADMWEIADTLRDTLSYTCKVAFKAQDHGHWFLSDGCNRLCDIYSKACIQLNELLKGDADESQICDTEIEEDCMKMKIAMVQAQVDYLAPFVAPFVNFDKDKAHLLS